MQFLVKIYPRHLNDGKDEEFVPVSRIRSQKVSLTMEGAPSESAAKQQIVRDMHQKGIFVKSITRQEQTQ